MWISLFKVGFRLCVMSDKETRDQIHITITSDMGVKALEELAGGTLSAMGRQLSLETSYVGDTEIARVDLKIHPSDVGNGIYETLKDMADGLAKGRMFREIMSKLGAHDKYLGTWDVEVEPLRTNVARYVKRIYEFTEDEWGVSQNDICSQSKARHTSRVRRSAFYALRRNFPTRGKKKSVLTVKGIGDIFGSHYATVVAALKQLGDLIPYPKIKDPSLVEAVLEEAVGTLERFNKDSSN